MKKVYSICLIFMLGVFSFSYYLSYQLTLNRQKEIQELESLAAIEEAMEADNLGPPIVNRTMRMILENHDLDTDLLTENEASIPVELLGLTRQEVVDYLKEISEDGRNYELMSFSEHVMRIRETVITLPPIFQCYLINENGYLLVYDVEKEESYITTFISIEEFPEEEQAELMDGKGFESMLDLYHYLESHTS